MSAGGDEASEVPRETEAPSASAPGEKTPAAPAKKRSSARRIFMKLALYGAALVLALALAEVFVRIAHPGPVNASEPEYLEDPYCHHRCRPGFKDKVNGFVSINSLGFRDSEDFPEKKPEGETRVVFLGDSFLYAALLPFEETFPERCERALAAKAGKVRAINTGAPGFGTNHERAMLEHYALPLSPDAVVLCFFVGNDVLETLTLDRWVVDADHALRSEKREMSLRKRLLMQSKLFQIIEATDAYQRIAHPRKFRKAGAQGTASDERYLDIEWTRLEQWRKGASARPPLDEAWRLVGEHLKGIVESSRSAGAAPVVLVIPDEIQVDATLRSRVCAAYSLDENDYDLEQPQRKLKELAQALSVPVVDVLPAFREQGSQGGLYIPRDTHWNARGHELAAGLLSPVLEAALSGRR
ncbi:SGNH/GDSL hydrolase family protein [bacterium]|nr:SGNH/GDSL hydrolase family protein [bacterium]